MKLIVGLGNPGPSYLLNRHNVGFIILDMIVHDYNLPDFKTKDRALITEGVINGIKCLFLKPMNFMNNSGTSLAQVANFYKIASEDIIVFHDELDLPFTKIKTKIGGGSGGHNGLKSIDTHLGKDYRRVRIGIDHPGHKDRVTSHVLGNFSKQEIEDLPYVLGPLSDELPLLLNNKPEDFQRKVDLHIQEAFKK
ncbi:MAG: aminoacyl-tRNA hydrolase [Alphaproteobacteria bacterium]|nr:aminoacyl-tRNA hydrolase [Alphaproteobacteria bacterium]